ncbi:hypothetical protein OOK60_09335 [Trichothermofontia sichuanensis B231]|uniref:hypothetical protein n=1 Tax=Trichothermofontia sichuanensis TaxID=3045816 RepID=UPI002247AB31|nr:hypothetical protein [Trichothermofontia sichuanensis]UZQ56229.1 hypothetical protein OOK60_09335 [Trichothermofontia sichuanensis B231]
MLSNSDIPSLNSTIAPAQKSPAINANRFNADHGYPAIPLIKSPPPTDSSEIGV